MDNQNTNGLNGVNNVGETINPLPNTNPELQSGNNNIITPITPENKLMQEDEGSGSAIVNSIPAASATPIRPSLDAILNGTSVENNVAQNNMVSLEQPVVNNAVASPINEASATPIEPIVNASPIFESIEPTTEVPNTINTQAITPAENVEANNAKVTSEFVEPITKEPTFESIPTTSTIETTPIATENNNINQGNSAVENEISSPMASPIENPTIASIKIGEPQEIKPISPVESLEDTIIKQENMPINAENLNRDMGNINPILPPNDFASVPVPPEQNNNNKKKKKKEREPKEGANVSSKALIVILLIILVAAIGFGVYYFLNILKTKAEPITIVTNDLNLELGSFLSQNIDNYATITGYQKENCTLDLNNIDMSKVSTYKYKVICGNTESEGTVIVNDTTKPQVTTTDITLAPNATLNAADFIEKCVDASKCNYSFATDVEGLTSKVGEYDVEILVSDEYNNTTTATAKLIISRNAPVKYLTCVAKEQVLEDISASFINTYKIGIDAKDTFVNATRKADFIFKDTASYESFANSYDKNVGIHEIVGTESFIPTENKISIKLERTLAEISFDINGNNNRTISNNATIIRAWLSGLDYTCN